jgi:hypothetical protein
MKEWKRWKKKRILDLFNLREENENFILKKVILFFHFFIKKEYFLRNEMFIIYIYITILTSSYNL